MPRPKRKPSTRRLRKPQPKKELSEKQQIEFTSKADHIDLGCGDAEILQELSKKHAGKRFVGIDTALENHFSRNLLLFKGDLVETLNKLPANRVKLINADFLFSAITHSGQIKAMVKAVHRVLNTQGRFYITMPSEGGITSTYVIRLNGKTIDRGFGTGGTPGFFIEERYGKDARERQETFKDRLEELKRALNPFFSFTEKPLDPKLFEKTKYAKKYAKNDPIRLICRKKKKK